MPIDVDALETELRRTIDEFADHDWGVHDWRPWMLGHALSVASGWQALEGLREGTEERGP